MPARRPPRVPPPDHRGGTASDESPRPSVRARGRATRIAALVAAVVGLATVTVAAPALGQVDPGAPSTTAVDEPSTTAVDDSTATTVGETPSTTETTEPATETTVPAPVNTPFPVSLVAPVPPVEGNPDTAITDLYVTDGATPEEPDVVVQFREPFTFAGTPYRVGVVIGDPAGTRLRAWLISNGPDNLPYGRLERFDAGSWTELGATPVRFESGLMIITVPIAEAPSGGAVWAEIVENDATTPSHTTPYFSRDALFGTAEAGTVPSAVFGRVFGLDGMSPDPLELPTGGTLVSIEDQIAVSYPDPAPSEVDGQPVTSAVDIIRIAPDYDDGAIIANFVRFDRTTGEVGLYDGFAPVPIDKSGDRTWLISAPPPREAGALVLDRAAIVSALDLPDAGAGLALGISREVALEDGRLITAEGVLATDAWLDLAPVSALPEVTTASAAPAAAADDTPGATSRLPLLIGAGVGLVVLLLMVLIVRRRRAHREEIAAFAAAAAQPRLDRMPWGSTDGDLIITNTHEFDALIPADATPLPMAKPDDPSAVPTGPVGEGVRILAAPVAGAPPTAPPAAPSAEAPALDPSVPPAAAAPIPATPPAAVPPGSTTPGPAVVPAAVPPEAPEPTVAAPPDAVIPVAVAPARSALDAEPAWGTAAAPGAADPTGTDDDPRPVTAAGEADEEARERPDDEEADVAPAALDPGRVDPMAALDALDQDMAELRRRVAGLGDG